MQRRAYVNEEVKKPVCLFTNDTEIFLD